MESFLIRVETMVLVLTTPIFCYDTEDFKRKLLAGKYRKKIRAINRVREIYLFRNNNCSERGRLLRKTCKESRVHQIARQEMSSWEIGGRKKSQEVKDEIVGKVNGKTGHYNVMEAIKKNFLKVMLCGFKCCTKVKGNDSKCSVWRNRGFRYWKKKKTKLNCSRPFK